MTHRSARGRLLEMASEQLRDARRVQGPGHVPREAHEPGHVTARGQQPFPVAPQEVQHQGRRQGGVDEAQHDGLDRHRRPASWRAVAAATTATPRLTIQVPTARRRRDVVRRYGSARRNGTKGATVRLAAVDGSSRTSPTRVTSMTMATRLANHAAPRVPSRARAQLIQSCRGHEHQRLRHVRRGSRRVRPGPSTRRPYPGSATSRYG